MKVMWSHTYIDGTLTQLLRSISGHIWSHVCTHLHVHKPGEIETEERETEEREGEGNGRRGT